MTSEDVPGALRRRVRLLSSVLGRVIAEAGDLDLLHDVEKLRRATIALRREATDAAALRTRDSRLLLLRAGQEVARAFTDHFQLVDLAEEHHRVRTLREREREQEFVADSLAAAIAEIRDSRGEDGLAALLAGLQITHSLNRKGKGAAQA